MTRARPRDARPGPVTVPPGDAPRVALVGDDPRMLASLRAALLPLGLRVRLFHGAAEAARDLPGDPPALVMTALSMPGLSGVELARRLRCHQATRDVPLVLLHERRAPLATGDRRLFVACASKRMTAREVQTMVLRALHGRLYEESLGAPDELAHAVQSRGA